MDFEQIAERVAERIWPGSLAAFRQRELEERQAGRVVEVERCNVESRPLIERRLVCLDLLDKAMAKRAKKQEALAVATAEEASVQRELQNINAALTALDRDRQRALRASASYDLLRGFRDQVEVEIEKAVPEISYVSFKTAMGERRDVPVAGDATTRRLALFRLRQEVLNQWPLEPLDDTSLVEKFKAAMEALPPIEPPPTAEEFIRRQNGASA
jgi:hypothetical protein